tara:strand:+ start:328 stop:468 length:141 start_codon:yes stop_codon:yes gene_type:complete
MEKNKVNQQKTQFNFLNKKTAGAPQRDGTNKGESALNFLKKTNDKL